MPHISVCLSLTDDFSLHHSWGLHTHAHTHKHTQAGTSAHHSFADDCLLVQRSFAKNKRWFLTHAASYCSLPRVTGWSSKILHRPLVSPLSWNASAFFFFPEQHRHRRCREFLHKWWYEPRSSSLRCRTPSKWTKLNIDGGGSVRREQRLTATEEAHNKWRAQISHDKTPPDRKIQKKQSFYGCFIKEERISCGPLMTSNKQCTAKKVWLSSCLKIISKLEALLNTHTHTLNVPALRQELSGFVCGQEIDNVKWIRSEESWKGRFIWARVRVCVTGFHFKLYQHWDLGEGSGTQWGIW